MAGKFQLVYSEGYGKPALYKCNGCGAEIKATQKPRSHVCGAVSNPHFGQRYPSPNINIPSVFTAPGGPSTTPHTPVPIPPGLEQPQSQQH